MRAEIKLYRDDGTLLIEEQVFSVEQGNTWEWKSHPADGPIVENGMAVYRLSLAAKVTPAAPFAALASAIEP